MVISLLWVATGCRIYVLRRRRSFIDYSYLGAAAGIAAGFTVAAFESPVDSVTGPYVSDLIEHLLVVAGGLGAQLFLLALRSGPLPRRAALVRGAIAAIVTIAMITAFVAAPIHRHVYGDLDEVYGHLRIIACYRLVFDGYLSYVLVDNVRLCRRYAAVRGNAGRTVSLTLVGWSSAVALIYAGSRIVYAAVDLTLNDRLTAVRIAGSVGASVGLCGLAIGMLAPRLVTIGRGWQESRDGTRRLHTLWRDLTQTFPMIVLATPSPVTPRRSALQYDRSVVEVGEGLTKARIPEHVLTELPADVDPVIQAAAALHRSRPAWTASEGHRAASLLPPPADPQQERNQLLALADAYAAQAAAREPAGMLR